MDNVLLAFVYLVAGIGAGEATRRIWIWFEDQREQEVELSRLQEPRIEREPYARSRKLEWQGCFEELTERIRERNDLMARFEDLKQAGASLEELATAFGAVYTARQEVAEAEQRIRDLDAERVGNSYRYGGTSSGK